MSENVSESEELSPKQQLLITALLTPLSIDAASKAVGVSDKTAHRWLKLPHFQQAYKAAQQQIYNAAIQELKSGLQDALQGLKRHIRADVEVTASSQVKAITYWIDRAITVEDLGELKSKIAILEEAHKKDEEK